MEKIKKKCFFLEFSGKYVTLSPIAFLFLRTLRARRILTTGQE